MQSLLWIAVACSLLAVANLLSKDEVHTLALGSAGIFTGLWGLATAPSLLQIGLGLLTVGWLQVGWLRS
ncbi:MAG: hypothetical protein AAFU71_11855 [Cyanobacteria bacterium J06632_22]